MAAYSKSSLLEHVHHEVRCRPALRGDARRRSGNGALRLRVGEVVRVWVCRQRDRRWSRGRYRVRGFLGRDDQAGGAERSAFEEVTPVDGISHGALLVVCSSRIYDRPLRCRGREIAVEGRLRLVVSQPRRTTSGLHSTTARTTVERR